LGCNREFYEKSSVQQQARGKKKRVCLGLLAEVQRINVMGLCGKVLVARGAIGVTSVRSCQNLPPCLTEPVPAGSKTDPPLAKAKPISEGGSAPGITYLRRGNKNCGKMAVKREG